MTTDLSNQKQKNIAIGEDCSQPSNIPGTSEPDNIGQGYPNNASIDVDDENYGVGIVRTSPRTGRKFYIPDVSLSKRPELNMVFNSVDEAYAFYEDYAKSGGFTIRKHTQKHNHYGVVSLKHFVCSKEGKKTYKKVNTLEEFDDTDSRNRPSIRTGCLACLKIKICPNHKYIVFGFTEQHNHPLVDENNYHMLNAARKLTLGQKELIYNLSKLNIGPVKAFSIMRTNCAGFEDVGATVNDCKNFKRNINVWISKYDCEMVVNRLLHKKDYLPDFSCEFLTDNKGSLVGLFWADQEMKKSYSVFGDVISFDSTFRTNKYNMVFVPFTGIDNHHRNICLGAALLGSETAESYGWLLNSFKRAHGREPRVVVTDQDAAMRKAILKVWPLSRHRLCMWHIMKKLAVKVGKTLRADVSFRKQLCNIVWTDMLEPCEFESKWRTIISDFELGGNTWLSDIYRYRGDWIPAHYRHEFMSGLMRTTSRSESENHFFGQFANSRITLVEFLSNFDTAIEAQRYKHRKNDHYTMYTVPDWLTDFVLEKEAQQIYTRNIFNDVQEAIQLAVHHTSCMLGQKIGDYMKFHIRDLELEGSAMNEVTFNADEMLITCTCRRYEQYGLLCRHIFHVLRSSRIRNFPSNYVMKRWTRDALPRTIFTSNKKKVVAPATIKAVQDARREITRHYEYIIDRLGHDLEKLSVYRDKMKNQVTEVDQMCGTQMHIPTNEVISKIFGFDQPQEVSHPNPVGIKTKGSGSKKRFKSIDEKITTKAARKPRTCHVCGSTEHDRRRCSHNKPATGEE